MKWEQPSPNNKTTQELFERLIWKKTDRKSYQTAREINATKLVFLGERFANAYKMPRKRQQMETNEQVITSSG